MSFEYPQEGQTNFLVKLGRPAAGGVGPDGDVVAFSDSARTWAARLVPL